MNQETSPVPMKVLALAVAVLVVGMGYLAVQYSKTQDSLADLTYKYRMLVSTDIANVPPSDFQLLLNTPPELIRDVLRSITVLRGEVSEITADTITLNAKIVDLEKVEDVLAGKEVSGQFQKPRQETLKTFSIALTPQTSYLLKDTPVRAGDLITVVTTEPVLYSDTHTAKYVFPTIPGLTN